MSILSYRVHLYTFIQLVPDIWDPLGIQLRKKEVEVSSVKSWRCQQKLSVLSDPGETRFHTADLVQSLGSYEHLHDRGYIQFPLKKILQQQKKLSTNLIQKSFIIRLRHHCYNTY